MGTPFGLLFMANIQNGLS